MKNNCNILIIDTTTNILRVGISYHNRRVATDVDKGFYHIENLLPTIDLSFEKLNVEKSDLDYIGVCCGPGSFTGMRIGIATALGISFALGIPSFGFSIFDIYNFLYKPSNEGVFVPVIDAKKNRFYCSFFPDELTQIRDISADEIVVHINMHHKNKKIFFGGSGVDLLIPQLPPGFSYETAGVKNYSADAMLDYCNTLLSENKKLGQPKPIYIRKSEAEIALLKKKGVY